MNIFICMAQFGNITNTGKARISSKYGPRNIGKGRSKNHKGIDIAYPSGTPIVSPLDGIIERANPNAGNCGGLIIINHGTFNGKNVKSKYCHVKKIDITSGEEVKKGQVVGLSGGGKNDVGRGNSMGPHIHFEILEDGKNVNPEPYYTGSQSGTQGEIPGKIDIKTSDGEDSVVGDNKKTTSRDIAKNLIKSLFGIGQDSSQSSEVVNEILRMKEIIEEQTPTFLTTQTPQQQSETNKTCGPRDPNSLPIKPCTSLSQNGSVTTYTGSEVISQDSGVVTEVPKGTYSQAIKIGNNAYYWNGTLDKQIGTNVSKGDKLGTTGSDKKLVTQPADIKTNNSQNKSNNQTTKSPLGQQTSDSKNQAKQIAKGLLDKLAGSQQQAPTTNTESINKLKPLIESELNIFNKLIK